jgi:glycosyltransferase involved in cell wall biosynthesis
MINGKRIAIVLPAYNAEKTLEATVREIPETVDATILVDDHSTDRTVELARKLGLQVFVHDRNYGYGRNQQTCYREALSAGADVVIMLHPDYQYTPLLVTAMASMVAYEVYDTVLGSRIIGGTALRGGMPFYKYVFNRLLTAFENFPRRETLRVSHRLSLLQPKVLTDLPLIENPTTSFFDNQMLAQCVHFGLYRRSVVPHEVFRRSLVHQLPAQRHLWTGRAAHHDAICAADMGARPLPDLQLERPQTRNQRHDVLRAWSGEENCIGSLDLIADR